MKTATRIMKISRRTPTATEHATITSVSDEIVVSEVETVVVVAVQKTTYN